MCKVKTEAEPYKTLMHMWSLSCHLSHRSIIIQVIVKSYQVQNHVWRKILPPSRSHFADPITTSNMICNDKLCVFIVVCLCGNTIESKLSHRLWTRKKTITNNALCVFIFGGNVNRCFSIVAICFIFWWTLEETIVVIVFKFGADCRW